MKYTRQEVFFGKQVQDFIRGVKVAIVGVGAIGSRSVDLLIRSGVEHIILIDRDVVEESNLGSQGLFFEEDVGLPKVIAAKDVLEGINPDLKTDIHFINLDHETVDLLKADLILDCTDNLEARYLINDYARKNKIPFVYASAIRDAGYVFPVLVDGPCLRCVLHNAKTTETCEASGVLNTITTLIASLQVNEALKILTKQDPERDLLYVHLRDNKIENIKVKKDDDCLVCKGEFGYLEGEHALRMVKHCSSGNYLVRKDFDFDGVKERLSEFGIVDFGDGFTFKNMLVLRNSLIIKAKSEKEALKMISQYIGN